MGKRKMVLPVNNLNRCKEWVREDKGSTSLQIMMLTRIATQPRTYRYSKAAAATMGV